MVWGCDLEGDGKERENQDLERNDMACIPTFETNSNQLLLRRVIRYLIRYLTELYFSRFSLLSLDFDRRLFSSFPRL